MKTAPLLLMILLCFCANYSTAQDTHYWTQQYGARAAFLGGAAIAGLDNNSSIFYNPANIAFIRESTVSLNTNVYKYEDISIKNGAGDSLDLRSQRFSLHPQMLSGLITKNPGKRWRMGFAVLTRYHANFDINQQHVAEYDVIPSHGGDEVYLGSVELQNHINETWACLGMGYQITDYLSAGITGIVSYRNQKHVNAFSARASYDKVTPNSSPFLASHTYDLEMRLNNIKALFKVGVHARFGAWRLGATFTTPSLNIWGESRVQRESTQNNIQPDQDISKLDQQRQLKTNFKQPLSAGLGVAYEYKKGLITVSAEYFGPIAEYQMIKGTISKVAYPSPPNGYEGEDFVSMYNKADQVINLGVGWEHKLTDVFTLHAGVRSDMSYRRSSFSQNRLAINSAPIDLYHVSSGVSWRRRASFFSFGVDYALTIEPRIQQLINLTSPTIEQRLLGTRDASAKYSGHTLTLLIGYTYFFALQ
ncbi:MAG: hypothetical protein GY810_31135 [Aureispira sp.]|nr:hypothetical protein [Aureispira sp.]